MLDGQHAPAGLWCIGTQTGQLTVPAANLLSIDSSLTRSSVACCQQSMSLNNSGIWFSTRQGCYDFCYSFEGYSEGRCDGCFTITARAAMRAVTITMGLKRNWGYLVGT